MSNSHGYNPYAPPASADEFVATSYDQYTQEPAVSQHATGTFDDQPCGRHSGEYTRASVESHRGQQHSTAQHNSYGYEQGTNYATQTEEPQYGVPYEQQGQPSAPVHQSQVQQTVPIGGVAAGYELQDQDQANYQFFNEVDDIKRNLVQYEDNIERIEGLHKRSLAESNVESEALIQRQLDGLLSETRGLAESLKQHIKQLQSTSQRDATKHAQADNLKHQFMAMIQKFQASEDAFRQRYRDVAARQYRIVEPDATEAEIQQAINDEQGTQVFSQALMQSNRRGEARVALTEVQARHREIQKIEATLMELAQLFQDMELMVAEQDRQVTNIETNVYTAQQDIERGVDNQHVAIKKARAWRKKKWWCVAILTVIILFCILFFAIYFGRK